MKKKAATGFAAALALGLCAMTSVHATVISGTPNVYFSNSIYTLDLVGDAASYSFTQGAADGFGGFNAAVKTGGSALLGANPPIFGGAPASYFTGPRAPFIDGSLAAFAAFDTFTTIPFSSVDTYLALAFDLDDGRHYGYAEISGLQFISYGYESVAGQGIQAGAMASEPIGVPEPGALAMLSLGLLMIGVGTAVRSRKS